MLQVISAAFILAPAAVLACVAVLHGRDRKRLQACAARAACLRCGRMLGAAAVARADAAWAGHLTELSRDRPGIRFRVVRLVWAICPSCGASYGSPDRFRTLVPHLDAQAGAT